MHKIASCMNTPTNVECLPDHGLPLQGFPLSGKNQANMSLLDTFKVTFFTKRIDRNLTDLSLRNVWEFEIDDYLIEKKNELAQQNILLTYMLNYQNHYQTYRFEEATASLSREFIVSILAHTMYLSWVLKVGRQPRIMLAVAMIAINLASITAGCGLLSYIGYPPPNNLFKIMPMLVMSIGVDNMAVLVICCDNSKTVLHSKYIGSYIGRTLCQIGSSLRVNSLCSIVGCLTAAISTNEYSSSMPVYVSVILTINWVLQETCFISILSVDLRRQAKDQCDPICGIHLRKTTKDDPPQESFLNAFIRDRFIPILQDRWCQIVIIIIHFALLCAWFNDIFYVEVGYNMDLYLANDTNLKKFVQFKRNIDLVGHQVYFVVSGNVDYSINLNRVIIDNNEEYSIPNLIERAGRLSRKKSYLKTTHVNSWWNDYEMWRLTPACCRLSSRNHQYCQPDR